MKKYEKEMTSRLPGKIGTKLLLKIAFMLLILISGTGINASAQEVNPASGGEASGSGGSVSYSVGQVFYSVLTGEDGSALEGVQQPYEISVVTGIIEAEGITLTVSAFPNPVTDYLMLRVENYDFENLEYLLFDISGKLLREGKVTGSETTISMTSLMPAVYFLKILQTKPLHREIKTFKIIKN